MEKKSRKKKRGGPGKPGEKDPGKKKAEIKVFPDSQIFETNLFSLLWSKLSEGARKINEQFL